jgi:hypothetical protein
MLLLQVPTREHHCLIPTVTNKIKIQYASSSTEYTMVSVSKDSPFNTGQVAWGTIRPHSILFYYSCYNFYAAACTFHIPLPVTLVVSARSITICWVTVEVWWVIHKLWLAVIMEHSEEHKDFRILFFPSIQTRNIIFFVQWQPKFVFHKPKFCKFWHHYR